MNTEEYRRHDYRVRCTKCKVWMRNIPTLKTPAQRAATPNASWCLNCERIYGRAAPMASI